MEEKENCTYFYCGPDEPKENTYPWFKDGKEWWVYEPKKSKYVPLYVGDKS